MAITKNNLSDFLRDTKLGGDPTLSGKIHPTMVWKAGDIVIGKMLEQAMYKDNDSNGYDINGEFISVFKNVSVKIDEDTNEKYSDLPAQLISLKDDRGITRVSEMKNLQNAFSITGNGSDDVYSILDVHYLNQKTEVHVQGNRLYYRNIRPAVKEVMIRMVAGIEHLDADTPIPIPGILELDFITMVSELLTEGKITTQDKSNDNNPNIPTG